MRFARYRCRPGTAPSDSAPVFSHRDVPIASNSTDTDDASPMKTHWINGRWQQGSGAEFFSANPASNEQVWRGRAPPAGGVCGAPAAAPPPLSPLGALGGVKNEATIPGISRPLTGKKAPSSPTPFPATRQTLLG